MSHANERECIAELHREAVRLWNMKKLGKQIGGKRYLQLRGVLLGHDPGVRWGDRE